MIAYEGKPSGVEVMRILGKGDLWITEYTIQYQGRLAYMVGIMEFRNGKVVHETHHSRSGSFRCLNVRGPDIHHRRMIE
jgi:hypothetical protein